MWIHLLTLVGSNSALGPQLIFDRDLLFASMSLAGSPLRSNFTPPRNVVSECVKQSYLKN
jgi:hypothetical protein